jgi:hypothetical protein
LLPYIAWSVLLTVVPTAGFVAFVRNTVRSLRYDGVGRAGHAVVGLIDGDRRADIVEPRHHIDLGCRPRAGAAGDPTATHVIAAMRAPGRLDVGLNVDSDA